MQTLRRLIVGPEQTRLDDVEKTIASPDSLGHLLPEAIGYAEHERRDALAAGLRKPVVEALEDAARREPEVFGRLLAPSIGTAVRRAVAEMFTEIMNRLNTLLERSLSVRSIKWRVLSWHSGRPYAEIVLSETYMYRVEWVVLIDTRTSLVLAQAAIGSSIGSAPDQISAMLQAISTFVSDAFQRETPGGELETFEVGDLNVWIERDPALTIAAAIRGAPPQDVRDSLRKTLVELRTVHAAEIDATPDPTQFADALPLLKECLREQRKVTTRAAQWMLSLGGIFLLFMIALFGERVFDRDRQERAMVRSYERVLAAEPGVVVSSVSRTGNGYKVSGLVDPRALPPAIAIARGGLPPAQLELVPFASADPRLEDPLAMTSGAISQLETIEIPFASGMSSVDPNDPHVKQAIGVIGRARESARQARMSLCVEILGSSDRTGTEATNAALRMARAESVADVLRNAGVPESMLVPRADNPARPYREARATTFRVDMRPWTAAGSECR